MGTIRIDHATIVTMNEAREIIADGEIFVRDENLEYVGPARPLEEQPEADQVLDATGQAALPGLINAHTHCAMTLLRGYADDMELMPWLETKIWPLEAHLTPEDVYWGALVGSMEMIKGGVTTFNDMYWHSGETVRAALDVGIRACPSGVLLGILPNAEEMVREAIAFVDEWIDAHPRIHVMFGPHAPYTCPDRLLQWIRDAARERGVPIHIHLAETAQEVQDSLDQHGRRPVEHLAHLGLLEVPVLAAHCNHLNDGEIGILREHGVGVSHNPGSNLKLATGFCPLPQLLEAGVTVGLGTDGTASNNNLDLLEEARFAALIHKNVHGDPTLITAEQALELATRGSAEALGLGHLIGQLTPGRRADLALLNLRSPHLWPGHHVVSDLVYAARADDVRTVLINGELILHEGIWTRLNETEMLSQASRHVEALLERAAAGPPAD